MFQSWEPGSGTDAQLSRVPELICARGENKNLGKTRLVNFLGVGFITLVYLSNATPLYPYDQRASENLNIRAVLESGYFG